MEIKGRLFCKVVLNFLDTLLLGLVGLLSLWLPLGEIRAQSQMVQPPILLDNMDGDINALSLGNASSGVQVISHKSNHEVLQHGTGSEQVSFLCPAGQSAQWVYPVPPSPVVTESRISVNVLCNRPGTLLAGLVVLPRSINRSSGKPHQILVRGQKIARGGNWQELRLNQIALEVHRQVRVARMQYGSSLDEREAYLSGIVVLAPGGYGATELYVDRVQLFGVLSPGRKNHSNMAGSPNPQDFRIPSDSGTSPDRPGVPAVAANSVANPISVVQWQGEPLEYLANLGFDGVRMGRLPKPEESTEALRLGLSLICPPPSPQELTTARIPHDLSAVTFWDLGKPMTTDELEMTKRWHQLVERYDPQEDRHSLVAGNLYTRAASRIGDAILVERSLLNSNMTFRQYSAWLKHHQRLVCSGTPIWATMETQLKNDASRQVSALLPASAQQICTTYPQLVAATTAAAGANVEVCCFSSREPLNSDQFQSRYRALALELLNLRRGLVKHWLTHGELQSGARSTKPDLTALVLKVERSHLLIPVQGSTKMQAPWQTLYEGPLSFVVPGVGESTQAYLLTMAGAQNLRHQRVTGGIRISLEKMPHDAFLLLTDDPQAFSKVSRYLRHHRQRTAEIRLQLAEIRHQQTFHVFQQLGNSLRSAQQVQKLLGQSQRLLESSKENLASKRLELSHEQSLKVEQTLDQAESLIRAESEMLMPFGLVSLQEQNQLLVKLTQNGRSPNLLIGGDFEDLPPMLDAGWRYQQWPQSEIRSAVRLAPISPYSGQYCLEMEALPSNENTPPALVPSAPLWITSSPVSAKAGDILEISGYVRVPKPLRGSVDGLQIIDSLGGEELAISIPIANTWKPFRVIRSVSQDTDVQVTLALTGLGTAHIDNLQIRKLQSRQQPLQLQATGRRSIRPH